MQNLKNDSIQKLYPLPLTIEACEMCSLHFRLRRVIEDMGIEDSAATLLNSFNFIDESGDE